MQLVVRDVAGLFNVSEKTIYRWVKQRKLPVYRVNEQYRFSRAELLEWATTTRTSVTPQIMHEPQEGHVPQPRLNEALQAGGVHYRVCGKDKASVLRAVVHIMRLPEEVDRQLPVRSAAGQGGLGIDGHRRWDCHPARAQPDSFTHLPADDRALLFRATGGFRGLRRPARGNPFHLDQPDRARPLAPSLQAGFRPARFPIQGCHHAPRLSSGDIYRSLPHRNYTSRCCDQPRHGYLIKRSRHSYLEKRFVPYSLE